MAPRPKQFAPELVAEGQRLYQQTVTPVRDIAAMFGISCTTLQNRIDEWGWKRRDYHSNLMRALRADEVAAASVRASAAAPPAAIALPAPADRAATAARIARVVERQMDAVERVLDVLGPANQIEAERTARTLASTARMLREIAAIIQPEQGAAPDEADDDPIPRDIDEFRRELARRINALIDARRDSESARAGETAGPLG